jgi:glycosyltransferase involved in cell wall biosynthesis
MEFYILLCRGGELVGDFRALGKVSILEVYDRIPPKTIRMLQRQNIKLVYSNTIANGAIQVQLKRLRCPILCHVHELAFSIENFFGDDNILRIKETTTLFLAGSKAVAQYLVDHVGMAENRVKLAYPFINIHDSRQMMIKENKPLKLAPGTIVVGACGTISWRKGTDIFLQIARLVLKRIQDPLVFVWVGGPLTQWEFFRLKYDAVQMDIDKNVIFTDNVSSHLPYFSQFDIFMLPSREDPFPLVILDAASLSIPIVCFDKAGGASEVVGFDAGIIVPYMDMESMAESIVALIENHDLRKKLGQRAREKVAQYDISVGGARILEIIKQSLETSLQER